MSRVSFIASHSSRCGRADASSGRLHESQRRIDNAESLVRRLRSPAPSPLSCTLSAPLHPLRSPAPSPLTCTLSNSPAPFSGPPTLSSLRHLVQSPPRCSPPRRTYPSPPHVSLPATHISSSSPSPRAPLPQIRQMDLEARLLPPAGRAHLLARLRAHKLALLAAKKRAVVAGGQGGGQGAGQAEAQWVGRAEEERAALLEDGRDYVPLSVCAVPPSVCASIGACLYRCVPLSVRASIGSASN
ncbi:unnamed protein product [Closterium sp. NIES-64]|nr:unnamed protein product [Closterium sp. NIES-64]